MARSWNTQLPNYISSDLSKARFSSPPRNRTKEIQIYIYESNQDILAIEKASGPISVQAKFSKNLACQITTPINFDIAKPKFASISDTGIWGGQLNGLIYDNLNLDSSKYNFLTFEILTNETISKIQKYRIVNLDKIWNNDNSKFLYGTISVVPDSIKTIPDLLKFNWQLVQAFGADTKTKYIKLIFEPKTLLFPNGLHISITPEKGEIARNDGYILSLWSANKAIKLVKIRQVLPLELDDLTFSDFQDRNITANTLGKTYIWSTEKFGFTPSYTENPSTFKIAYNSGLTPNIQNVEQFPFFSQGIKISKTTNSIALTENILDLTQISNFLQGTFQINNHILEKTNDLTVQSDFKKLDQLDENSANDRLYFLLGLPNDLTKFVDLIRVGEHSNPEVTGIWAKSDFPKTRLLRTEEWGRDFANPPSQLTCEIELNVAGFNPKIEIWSILGNSVKITQYDENHKVIGIPNLNFALENYYSDNKNWTVIQL